MHFLARIPNAFVKSENLSIRDKLFLLAILTWPMKMKNEDGQENRSSQQFGGRLNVSLLCRSLRMNGQAAFGSGKGKRKICIHQHLCSTIIGKQEQPLLEIRKRRSGRNLFNVYSLNKSIRDYQRYFILPEDVLRLKLHSSLRMALVICFMLRERACYRLKNNLGLSRSIQRYLGLSIRRSKAIVQELALAGYIQRDDFGVVLLPHPDFEHFWEHLPKRTNSMEPYHATTPPLGSPRNRYSGPATPEPAYRRCPSA